MAPLALLALLVYDLKAELAAPYGGYSRIAILMIGRDWLMVALIISLFVAMMPWKRTLKVD
jgi:hypothetical protein